MKSKITSNTINRVERLTPDMFKQDYASSGKPVVITDAISDWKALGLWSPDYLKSKIGKIAVPVSVSPNGVFSGDPKKGFAGRSQMMTVGNFIDLITSRGQAGKRYYIQQKAILQVFPKLAEDIKLPDYLERRLVTAANLWFGSGGNISPLHYDATHNLLAQVVGQKRVVLFSPRHLRQLYPFSTHSRIPHLSRVDIEHPDYEKYPRFRKAEAIECILGPGDVLFIPAFWWHQVHSLDITVSVNFWWKPPLRSQLSRASLRYQYRHQVYERWQNYRSSRQKKADLESPAKVAHP